MAEFKDQIALARNLAKSKHDGQLRANKIDPYFKHLEECSRMAKELGMDDDCVAAMYLHDILEDTDVTVTDLRKMFNNKIVVKVIDLTDKFTEKAYPQFNRDSRKTLEWKRFTNCPADIQTMKLIDMYSNSLEMHDLPLDFAIKCFKERKIMLRKFKKADPRIADKLRDVMSRVRLCVMEK